MLSSPLDLIGCRVCSGRPTNLLPVHRPPAEVRLIPVCLACFGSLWVAELKYCVITISPAGVTRSTSVISEAWLDDAAMLAVAVRTIGRRQNDAR